MRTPPSGKANVIHAFNLSLKREFDLKPVFLLVVYL